MKKSILIFVVALLVLVAIFIWILNTGAEWDLPGILMISVGIIIVGFAIYIGIERFKSKLRKEPPEDELSKSIMTRASSLSYYISIYLWLFIMYFSDRVNLEIDTMIGAGILGMAIIFFLSWVVIKFFGLKNG